MASLLGPRRRASPVDVRSHSLECPDCCGAGECSSNGHDPNADIFECDRCGGTGGVDCDGCDECEADALADAIDGAEDCR